MCPGSISAHFQPMGDAPPEHVRSAQGARGPLLQVAHVRQPADEGRGAQDHRAAAAQAQLGQPALRAGAPRQRRARHGLRARRGTQHPGAQYCAGARRPHQGHQSEAEGGARRLRLCACQKVIHEHSNDGTFII